MTVLHSVGHRGEVLVDGVAGMAAGGYRLTMLLCIGHLEPEQGGVLDECVFVCLG